MPGRCDVTPRYTSSTGRLRVLAIHEAHPPPGLDSRGQRGVLLVDRPLLVHRDYAVAEASIDHTLRRRQGRQRLAPLVDVRQLALHHPGEHAAPPVCRQDPHHVHERGRTGAARQRQLHRERVGSPHYRLAVERRQRTVHLHGRASACRVLGGRPPPESDVVVDEPPLVLALAYPAYLDIGHSSHSGVPLTEQSPPILPPSPPPAQLCLSVGNCSVSMS